MAERATVNEVTQIGAEVTAGTLVAASKRLLCTQIMPVPDIPVEPYRPAGFKVSTTAIRQKEMTNASLEGVVCYNDLVYLLAGIMVDPVITIPAGATNTRRWTFEPSSTAPDETQTYTIEHGGPNGAERFVFAAMDSLSLTWNRTEATVGGSMIGREFVSGVALTGSPADIPALPVDPHTVSVYVGASLANEVQTVTIGTHTGGTFTLAFTGPEGDTETTAAIASAAAAAAVQSALEALPNIQAGDVAVTGAASPWTVTFQGRLAGYNQELLVIDGALLTGGAGEGVTQTTAGGLTKLTRCSAFSVSLGNRYEPQMTLDAGQDSFSAIVETPVDGTAELVLQHNSESVAYLTSLRDKTTLFCAVVAHGPETESGFNHRIKLLFPFKFQSPDLGDQDAVYAATWPMQLMHSSSLGSGTWMQAVVDNLLTAL